MTIDEEKNALRARMRKVRADAFNLHGATAARALAELGIGFADPARGAVVSGFLPIGEEIDLRPLLSGLHARGHPLVLPVMQGRDKPLIMRAWSPGDELERVKWGIEEPFASAAEMDPDIVLVPLLAFDLSGQRLGYGRGFYDRTLALLKRKKKITTIGVAFDEQRVSAVAHAEHDEPLDWMLTPSGFSRCTG